MSYQGFDKTFSLTGKTAVITGSASGIGLAIATLFSEKGAKLVLLDKNDSVLALAKEFTQRGTEAWGRVCDVTVRDNVENVTTEAIERFGSIDILVNNAGIGPLQPAEDLTEANWDRTMAINLKAPYMLAQVIGRTMIARKSGKIVNIASQAGIVALEGHLAYCASKAAVISMTKVLALEWGKYGINVNAISPTVVLTELGKIAWGGEAGESLLKKIPIGRFAYPEEVAAAALFLASDAAAMIHGENLVIDGGYTIQ